MFGSEGMKLAKKPMRKSKDISAGWTPTMEQRADLEGRQVKCLIASEGHLWMQAYYDQFPAAVRQRLAASPFNICAACADEEAWNVARQRGEKKTFHHRLFCRDCAD